MSGSDRWGWHRLDATAAERLVADADLPDRSLVLDIGAGHGAITDVLVAHGHRVVAVELHLERARYLRRRYADTDRVVVVRADASDLRLPRRGFHVVANPSFASSSVVIRRLLHPGSRLISARVVLQDQSARRWGSADAPARQRWGHRFVATAGPRVPRRAFAPPPPVAARILRIESRTRSASPGRR